MDQIPEEKPRPRHQARLPGFVADAPVGLGDVIKRATSSVGLRPCGGCQRRAAALNRWMGFTGRARGPR
jgi:hypothetical protein